MRESHVREPLVCSTSMGMGTGLVVASAMMMVTPAPVCVLLPPASKSNRCMKGTGVAGASKSPDLSLISTNAADEPRASDPASNPSILPSLILNDLIGSLNSLKILLHLPREHVVRPLAEVVVASGLVVACTNDGDFSGDIAGEAHVHGGARGGVDELFRHFRDGELSVVVLLDVGEGVGISGEDAGESWDDDEEEVVDDGGSESRGDATDRGEVRGDGGVGLEDRLGLKNGVEGGEGGGIGGGHGDDGRD